MIFDDALFCVLSILLCIPFLTVFRMWCCGEREAMAGREEHGLDAVNERIRELKAELDRVPADGYRVHHEAIKNIMERLEQETKPQWTAVEVRGGGLNLPVLNCF